MNTFDIDTISNNLAHEAAAHHRTRLATDRIHKDMTLKQEAEERRSLIAQAHNLTVFTNTQAQRTTNGIAHEKPVDCAIAKLTQVNDSFIQEFGVSLLTMFAATTSASILRELQDFWTSEINNTNAQVTALASGGVILPDDLPYFLLAPVDFPKGCRRRFFMRFAFLKHYGKDVNNHLWMTLAAMHKAGYFTATAATSSASSTNTAE
jgi:hypothetical protein